MYIMEVEYDDYNDNHRKEKLMFHLNEAEIAEMQLGHKGGLTAYINRVTQGQDNVALANLFKEFVTKAYGVKSDDGKRFIKNKEVLDEFMQSEAYPIVYMKLATDDVEAAKFMKEVLSKKLQAEVAKAEAANKIDALGKKLVE